MKTVTLIFFLLTSIQLRGFSQGDTLQKSSLPLVLDKEYAGYPVSPFRDTLFYVFARIGPVTAAERAEMISVKIRNIYKKERLFKDSMFILEEKDNCFILYRNLLVMAVTTEDAAYTGKSRKVVASEYRDIIVKAIGDEMELNSFRNIISRIGIVIAIIAGVVFLLILLNWLFSRMRRYLMVHKDRFTRRIIFRDYELINRERVLSLVLWFTTVIKYFIFIVLIYSSLPFIFLVFPVTKGWAVLLITWVITPLKVILQSIVKFLPDLITIIIIIIVFRYLIKLIRYFSSEIENGKLNLHGFHADWAKPTFNIIRVILYAFMFVVIFPYLPGSGSPVFQGVTVFLGILFSLGSSSAISNAVSGIVITYMRPYKAGDRIKIGESIGDVVEKNLLVTRIRTIKNEDITIPNSLVMSGHTLNYSSVAKQAGLILHTSVTIGYDAPWRTIHQLLISAAEATDGLLKDPKPFVLQRSLNDFYISYEINAFTTRPNEQVQIYSRLHENIQDKFNEAGMEIMSPHYTSVRDGNTIAIPENYHPEGYEAPAFRFKKRDG